MKRTLSLIALAAALLAPTTLGSTTTISVTGVVINANDLSKSTGWYDANKGADRDYDGQMCWAASSSNIVAWWQDQQDPDNLPKTAPTDLQDIWDQYRQTWANVGGLNELGLHWWIDGRYSIGNKSIPPRAGGQDPAKAGYYADSLYTPYGYAPGVQMMDLKVLDVDNYNNNVHDLSADLVRYIQKGYGVELSWVVPNWSSPDAEPTTAHSVTLWGVEYDEENRIITDFYLTDSDDYQTALTKVAVHETTDYWGAQTLAKTSYKREYTAMSFTVLNSRLSNDIHYFNYQDSETHDIILQQSVNGKGYTLSGTQEVRDIVFDDSHGTQSRLLTVEGEHAAGTLFLNGAGVNTVNVTDASKLAVEQISGGQNLTKAGAGTLEIQGGTATGALDIQAGVVLNKGALGEVTLSDGGRLENQGTATKLTVNSGSVAEMKNNSGQQAFTQATVNDGGTLKGSGQFGKVTLEKGGTLVVGNAPVRQTYTDELIVNGGTLVFSIDDALNSYSGAADADNSGWGSGRYSTISMSNKSLTLNPDEIKINLGETILKRSAGVSDLENALGTPFTINLANVDILMDINYNNPLFSFYTGEAELQRLAGITTFSLSDDDGAFSIPGLQAIITPESVAYATQYGTDVMLNARLSVTLAAAPEVPEPTTGTLGLLALAGLCARRRRK